MLTKQERLLSLNGSFEGLAIMMKAIINGKIESIDEAKKYIVTNMEYLNKEMYGLEKELGIK